MKVGQIHLVLLTYVNPFYLIMLKKKKESQYLYKIE